VCVCVCVLGLRWNLWVLFEEWWRMMKNREESRRMMKDIISEMFILDKCRLVRQISVLKKEYSIQTLTPTLAPK
jgi:hypothetical protein